MNSRNFTGGYKEILPGSEAIPSILTTTPVKRILEGPRDQAATFDFYAMDALQDGGMMTSHIQDEVANYLDAYAGSEARHIHDEIMNKMVMKSKSNSAFNRAVDELHFHTLNRPLVDQWRYLLLGEEFAPSPARISIAQEQLAIAGLHHMALLKQLSDSARSMGIQLTAKLYAERHITNIDTAIALLEYQKLRAETSREGDHHLAVVAAPPRFHFSPRQTRQARFIMADVALDTVKGVRPHTTLTEVEVENDYDRQYVVPIDGVADLHNFHTAGLHGQDDSMRLVPRPGLISVSILTQHAEHSIAAAVRESEFSTRSALRELLEAKSIAKDIAEQNPQFDFSNRAQEAALRMTGTLTRSLRRAEPPQDETTP